MSEATLSLAVAAVVDAIWALERGDTEAVKERLGQVAATLEKAERERAEQPARFMKTIEDVSCRMERRIIEGQRRRG